MKTGLYFILFSCLFTINIIAQNPTVSSFSPADNTTGVLMRTGLAINFSEDVVVGSGNITIYQSSDDSVVEVVSVTGGQVSGNGTSLIEIELSNDLQCSTEYYVQIASTCFEDLESNAYSGIGDNTTWNFTTSDIATSVQRKILASDGTSSHNFGKSVAVSGNFAVVGAPFSNSNKGSVYVYDISSGQELYQLKDVNGISGDGFGTSVSISGKNIVVGVPNKTRPADPEVDGDYDREFAGAVFVYDISTGEELDELVNMGWEYEYFGYDVSVSDNYIVVGSTGYYDWDKGIQCGCAYVFNTSDRSQLYQLIGSGRVGSDEFGGSVAVIENYAVVGASNEKQGPFVTPGVAYIFDLTTGSQQNRLVGTTINGARFGESISASGSYAIVGAPNISSSSGKAFIYNLSTGSLVRELTAEDASGGDYFGTSVSISGDYVVIGASGDNSSSGSAYIYQVSSGAQLNKVTAGDGSGGDYFGSAVAISDDYALIGAYGNDDGGDGSGSVYSVDYRLTTPPTIQASDMIFTNVTSSSATLSWTRGDGNACAVFMYLGDQGEAYPALSTGYSANAFLGAGSQIGSSGWYCVYDGTGTTVDVTNMTSFSVYQAQVFEYNGTGGIQTYLPITNGTNPAEVRNCITWVGTTTVWDDAGNWIPQSVPGTEDDVLIKPGFSPTISSSYSAPTVIDNMKIESGAVLTVNANSALTLDGFLTNEGDLVLAANTTANDRSGAIITKGSISNTGTMTLYRNVSGSTLDADDKTWHSLGIPVGDVAAVDFFTGDYMYEYDEPTNAYTNIVAGTVNRGNGYLVKTINGDKVYEFTGTFNTGTYSYDLTNTGPDADHGYNFISNPYPSQINLDNLNVTDISMIYVWDHVSGNYLYYQIGSGGNLSEILESCQGFFVKVSDASATGNVTFDDAARTHATSGGSLKAAKVSPPQVKLKVSNGQFEDVLMVNETDVANEGYKLFSMNADAPQIYARDEIKDYCIYNMSQVVIDDVIPVGFKSNASGTYTIDITEQSFAEFDVTLVDKLTTQEYPLAQGASFEIEHDASNSEDRFEIVFKQTGATDVDDNIESNINIYSRENGIIINSGTKFNYTIYSVSGDIIKTDAEKIGEKNIQVNSGIYIVKVTSDKGVETRKVLVK